MVTAVVYWYLTLSFNVYTEYQRERRKKKNRGNKKFACVFVGKIYIGCIYSYYNIIIPHHTILTEHSIVFYISSHRHGIIFIIQNIRR